MTIDKDQAADALIRWHFEVEPGLSEVFRIMSQTEADPEEPIKLLEVNEGTLATNRVEAFAFGPTKEIPFSTVIAEVTSDELQAIRQNKISLPDGWHLETARSYRRSDAA